MKLGLVVYIDISERMIQQTIYIISNHQKKKKVLKEDIGLKNMINKSYGSKWSFIIIVVVVVVVV